MREPDFNILNLPRVVISEIDRGIDGLRYELHRRNAQAMIEPLRRLSKVRGNFAFDLISSIAWAAHAVCDAATDDRRALSAVEARSLVNALDSMDRARRTAQLAVAV